MSLKSKSSRYLAKSSTTFIFPYAHSFIYQFSWENKTKQNKQKQILKYSICISKLAEGYLPRAGHLATLPAPGARL